MGTLGATCPVHPQEPCDNEVGMRHPRVCCHAPCLAGWSGGVSRPLARGARGDQRPRSHHACPPMRVRRVSDPTRKEHHQRPCSLGHVQSRLQRGLRGPQAPENLLFRCFLPPKAAKNSEKGFGAQPQGLCTCPTCSYVSVQICLPPNL